MDPLPAVSTLTFLCRHMSRIVGIRKYELVFTFFDFDIIQNGVVQQLGAGGSDNDINSI